MGQGNDEMGNSLLVHILMNELQGKFEEQCLSPLHCVLHVLMSFTIVSGGGTTIFFVYNATSLGLFTMPHFCS